MKLKLSLEVGDLRLECEADGDSYEALKERIPKLFDSAAEYIEFARRVNNEVRPG